MFGRPILAPTCADLNLEITDDQAPIRPRYERQTFSGAVEAPHILLRECYKKGGDTSPLLIFPPSSETLAEMCGH
jgi:hypothetical protein